MFRRGQNVHSRIRVKTAALLLAAAAPGGLTIYAQEPPPPVAMVQGQGFRAPDQSSYPGIVTGRIVCADTQRPARFALVTLVPVNMGNGGGGGGGQVASGRTDLDGSFTIANVAPGDYYLTASATGYVSEAALVQAGIAAGADQATLLASLPQVRVSNGAASGNLSLQRGGVISGMVQWDDGSPASGVQISAVPANGTGTARTGLGGGMPFLGGFGAGGNTSVTSDDEGHFRLNALAPGAYLVRATVMAPVSGSGFARGGFGGGAAALITYAPGKVRRTEATTVVIHGSEERDDAQVVLPLSAMHSVTGHVGASSGGATVASGTVRLQDQTDNTLQRTGTIGSDGSFTVPWVPSGTYTLTATGSSTPAGGGRNRPSSGGSFQPFQESITVADGDLSGLNINLSPASGGQQ